MMLARVLGRRLIFGGVAILVGGSLIGARAQRRLLNSRTQRMTLTHDGQTRDYLVHVPLKLPAGPAALVMVFHGGGGNAVQTERFTGFSELADREGFIAVYPDGIGNNWNDGRDAPNLSTQMRKTDDVGFISAVIDQVSKTHAIDPKRVYATGISNGGIFSYYLAAHLSDRIAAIAPVAGNLAKPFAPKFKPASPVSVFAINGTADPLVPYEGGNVARRNRGEVLSVDETLALWRTVDGCETEPASGSLPDRDPSDGCVVRWSRWPGKGGTEVLLYRIEGGGHTWPGRAQYLPKRIIGPVCRDFDGAQAIWDFFKGHPKA